MIFENATVPDTWKLYVGAGTLIPILPPADPDNGAPIVEKYDPVPNNIPPILIAFDADGANDILVPIIMLLDPNPLAIVPTRFAPA